MSLTRNGVAYNFETSPYYVPISYNGELIKFVFSTESNRVRFIDKLQSNREKINNSLSNRFGFTIINNKLADIKLYTITEKRGFLIKTNEEGLRWQENIILDGNNLISKN